MNYFLPNPNAKGGLSENSIAIFFPLNTSHPSKNNTQEPLKTLYEMKVSLIVWSQECFIWFMDSAASLATWAKTVQVINYRDAWNYRLGGTCSQRFQGKVQYARCSQNKSEKEVAFAWQVPGCTNFTWLLICELGDFRQGEEERKGNTHSELLWQTQGSDKHQ